MGLRVITVILCKQKQKHFIFCVYFTLCVCVILFKKKVEEEVILQKGSSVRVVTAESDKDETDGKVIWVDYPNIAEVLTEGGKIYIDDGLIGLKVTAIGEKHQFVSITPSSSVDLKMTSKIYI